MIYLDGMRIAYILNAKTSQSAIDVRKNWTRANTNRQKH